MSQKIFNFSPQAEVRCFPSKNHDFVLMYDPVKQKRALKIVINNYYWHVYKVYAEISAAFIVCSVPIMWYFITITQHTIVRRCGSVSQHP